MLGNRNFDREYQHRIMGMHIELTLGRILLGSAEGREAYERLRSALFTPPLLSQFMRERWRTLSQEQFYDVVGYFFSSSIGEDAIIRHIKTITGVAEGCSVWTDPTANHPLCGEYLDSYDTIIRALNQSDPRVITCATGIFGWLRAHNATVFAEPLWGMISTVQAPLMQRSLMSKLGSLQDKTAADMEMIKCLSDSSTPDDVWSAALGIVARLAQLHQAFLPVFVERLRGVKDENGYEQVRHLAVQRNLLALFSNAFRLGARRNTGAYTPLILPPLPPEEPRPIVQHTPVVITMDDLRARVPVSYERTVRHALSCTSDHVLGTAQQLFVLMQMNNTIMCGMPRIMADARDHPYLSSDVRGKVGGFILEFLGVDFSGNGHEMFGAIPIQALLRCGGRDPHEWQKWETTYQQQIPINRMKDMLEGDNRIDTRMKFAYQLGVLAGSEVAGDIEYNVIPEENTCIQHLSPAERAFFTFHAEHEGTHAGAICQAATLALNAWQGDPEIVALFWKGFADFFDTMGRCYEASVSEDLPLRNNMNLTQPAAGTQPKTAHL